MFTTCVPISDPVIDDVFILASSHMSPLLPLAENSNFPFIVTFRLPTFGPYIW